ncbi:hypothetical protein DFH11DRAFT_20752 [Phellopilus nigrolimitatus]|nr:hypothetical protein DFH11DRAFT_20752 [Phellopilus nigrolimitatus]
MHTINAGPSIQFSETRGGSCCAPKFDVKFSLLCNTPFDTADSGEYKLGNGVNLSTNWKIKHPSDTATHPVLASVNMAPKYSIELNNFLQRRNEAHLINWLERPSGPQNSIMWTLTCKFKGEVVGEGTAAQKVIAKEAACEQALKKLSGA